MMKPFALASCLAVSLAACGDDDSRSGTVTPDAQTRVSGCDDPSVWTLPALAAAEPKVEMGDYPCGPAQLPLHRVEVGWIADSIEQEQGHFVNRACWRVTEASPGSGWTVGQQFSSISSARLHLVGFDRPITVEGRAISDDGTIVYAIAPAKIELAPPMILDHDAASVTGVIGRDGWAEHAAVHLWGQRIPTEEVLGVASFQSSDGLELGQITLHRVGTDIVLRTWTRENDQLEYSDFVIGPGTRAQITKRGNAVLVDGTELVILNRQLFSGTLIVRRRITLPAAPLEMIEDMYLWIHMPGMVMRVGLYDDLTQTLAVGDGRLVPAIQSYPSYFFDGSTFHELRQTYPTAEIDPIGFTPSADDLARLGKPVGVVDGGVMIGEHGFLAGESLSESLYGTDSVFGPASASFADVFGDGHLGPLSVDNATYVIEHDTGSAALYQAPYKGYCDPFL